MYGLLFLAASAAAQFASPIPVRLALQPGDDFEDLLQRAQAGPAVTPPGLVIVRSQVSTTYGALPPGLEGLLSGFFPTPRQETFVVTRYDDDEEEAHDFGCPCGDDVARLCAGSAGDDLASVFETRLCLARAKDALSERCFDHLAEAPTVVEYCAADIARACPGVAPGENRVHACLAAQEALTGPCGRYVASVGPSTGMVPDNTLPEAELPAEASDLVRTAFALLDSLSSRSVDDELLAPQDDWGLREGSSWMARFGFEAPAPREAAAAGAPDDRTYLRRAAPAPAAEPRDWAALEEAMEQREEEAYEEAEEEELAEEEREEQASALANLLLALCFLAIGLSTFVMSYVLAYALRKRRERNEVAEFKSKFAPLMKEGAPASP